MFQGSVGLFFVGLAKRIIMIMQTNISLKVWRVLITWATRWLVGRPIGWSVAKTLWSKLCLVLMDCIETWNTWSITSVDVHCTVIYLTGDFIVLHRSFCHFFWHLLHLITCFHAFRHIAFDHTCIIAQPDLFFLYLFEVRFGSTKLLCVYCGISLLFFIFFFLNSAHFTYSWNVLVPWKSLYFSIWCTK